MKTKVPELVKRLRPNIVVITGHDALEDKEHEDDLNSYRSSKYFVETVNALREIEPSLDYLIVIAGACQSHFADGRDHRHPIPRFFACPSGKYDARKTMALALPPREIRA